MAGVVVLSEKVTYKHVFKLTPEYLRVLIIFKFQAFSGLNQKIELDNETIHRLIDEFKSADDAEDKEAKREMEDLRKKLEDARTLLLEEKLTIESLITTTRMLVQDNENLKAKLEENKALMLQKNSNIKTDIDNTKALLRNIANERKNTKADEQVRSANEIAKLRRKVKEELENKVKELEGKINNLSEELDDDDE